MESENSGMNFSMPVAPTGGAMPYPVYMGGNSGGSGGGMFGGQDGWGIIVIILILAALGGWGNNGGNNGGFGGGQPIIVNDGGSNGGAVQRGFDQAAVMAGLTGIQTGISNLSGQICDCCGNISNQLCNGFSGVNATINGAQNAISNQLYNNEISSLNRSFAEQTANTAGFNGVQSSLCDIRYGNATNTRDIIESQTRGTQAILDKLCQVELDGYKRENDQLRTQLNMANLAASQTAQTAELRTSQATVANQLVAELRSCPIPAQPVYGNQPIFQCSGPAWNNNSCGCGCGNNNFIG